MVLSYYCVITALRWLLFGAYTIGVSSDVFMVDSENVVIKKLYIYLNFTLYSLTSLIFRHIPFTGTLLQHCHAHCLLHILFFWWVLQLVKIFLYAFVKVSAKHHITAENGCLTSFGWWLIVLVINSVMMCIWYGLWCRKVLWIGY